MNVVAIVQARMGSTRLPNKVMLPVNGVPLILILFERLSLAQQIDNILLATSIDTCNTPLAHCVKDAGYGVCRGSENDVLDRFYQAARQANADVVVRITGDCPLIDPKVVDSVIKLYFSQDVDYASNTNPPSYPDGLDTEVFSFKVLEKAWKEARDPHQREHVTPFLCESPQFSRANSVHSTNESEERWTVDEHEDFVVVKKVLEYFHPRLDFSWLEVLELRHLHPEWFTANQYLIRNEGAQMGSGQKLWKRAKQIIPGGNMLLSKRAELFLPDNWPAYFSKAKGCKVWDLDGKEYIDMSIMGIGTNILGYGNKEVDDAVRQTIDFGNMSTLNCPEEVYLAEKLIDLHPWADMARFARTGGEANAVAIRIARAATGKEKVAVCGYHGWHDWYLAANIADQKNLAGHLLPGLEPNGVPISLRDTVYPFNYNKFSELKALVDTEDIGIIKMEVSRNQGPEDGFLEKVRDLASKKGIVLIFDECTSGFRQNFGGLHKFYGVEPDMAMFGKALGNGYAITATIGRREVMEAAQTSFISSTFWTERIGPTAGLKTLEVMERLRSWDTITATGNEIKRRWQQLADRYDLQIELWGLPALAGFSFKSPRALMYKTLITQEMLKRGYLASDCVYSCIDHSPDIINGYFTELESIFALLRECEQGKSVADLLNGPVCHSGFKRLN